MPPDGREVLLVVADAAGRFALTRLLQRAGHPVEAPADLAGALGRLAGLPPGRPEVLVVESSGPAGDLARLLAARDRRPEPRPRLIVLGTRADPMEAARIRALGAERYLVKPFLSAELAAAVAAPPPPEPAR
jgi:DNA-binding response OmpR family regulator